DQHAEIALGCLKSGAHCYIEKPLVRTCQEADAVRAEAERRQRRVAVAHTMRMSPAVRRLRDLVAAGRIGDLREMQVWGKQDARAGGEDLMVLGTHLMDLMRLFAGDPLWISARITSGGRDITVTDRRHVRDEVGWVAGDTVRAQIAFGNGVQGNFTSDGALRETTGHWGIEFRGSRGVARLRCDLVPSAFLRASPSWTLANHPEEWVPLDGVAAMAPEDHNRVPVSDWLDAIAAGREPECGARNAAWAIEMVSAAYQSALGAGRVAFPLTDRRGPLDD
ncbi:MAG: Gfo/Idh/MocA family oxidoreductase, partial [Verrucomicrobia bacterium]|nr:Gfo/Idh/MocA family oxidoreductase [Verrucomicrobiota bacterium]